MMLRERTSTTTRRNNAPVTSLTEMRTIDELISRTIAPAPAAPRDIDDALDNAGPVAADSFPPQDDPLRSIPATLLTVSGLNTWSGRVLNIEDDFFSAELIPDSNTPGETVVADFKLSLLDEPDGTLRVGDVVYLTSRVVRTLHGRKTETASVRLRRLGAWSKTEVEAIRQEARELYADLEDLFE